MPKQLIYIGSNVNDRTGDTLRDAFSKVNDNFGELYTATGGGDFADVATSGDYNDLINKPFIPSDISQLTDSSGSLTDVLVIVSQLPASALSGSYNDLIDLPDLNWHIGEVYHKQGSYNLLDSGSIEMGGLGGGSNTRSYKLNGQHMLSMGSNGIASNVAVGRESLQDPNLVGQYNVGVGSKSLKSNFNGEMNTALGTQSQLSNVGGSRNTSTGTESLRSNVSGSDNVSVGYRSLYSNQIGTDNTAVGKDALRLATGSNNLAIGGSAGSALTLGNNNVIIGSNDGTNIIGKSNQVVLSDGEGNVGMLIDSSQNTFFTSSVKISGQMTIDTIITQTNDVSVTILDTFPVSKYRSARYTLQVENHTQSTFHTSEILLLQDNTDTHITEFGSIYTGQDEEASFSADVFGGEVRLLCTPSTSNNMTFKVIRQSIDI